MDHQSLLQLAHVGHLQLGQADLAAEHVARVKLVLATR